jgi:hypothetical protein
MMEKSLWMKKNKNVGLTFGTICRDESEVRKAEEEFTFIPNCEIIMCSWKIDCLSRITWSKYKDRHRYELNRDKVKRRNSFA